MRRTDHDLRTADVRGERAERLVDNELDADRGGKMDDDVAAVRELVDLQVVEDRADDQLTTRVIDDVAQIRCIAGGKVVEDDDVLAPRARPRSGVSR